MNKRNTVYFCVFLCIALVISLVGCSSLNSNSSYAMTSDKNINFDITSDTSLGTTQGITSQLLTYLDDFPNIITNLFNSYLRDLNITFNLIPNFDNYTDEIEETIDIINPDTEYVYSSDDVSDDIITQSEIADDFIEESVSCNIIEENIEEEFLDIDIFDEEVVFDDSYTQKPQIALTFDDGPSATVTPLLLDLLAEYDVKATFFQLGLYLEENEEIVKRVIDEGHQLGNHSYSHANLTSLDKDGIIQEIYSTSDIMHSIIGDDDLEIFIRPPYGAIDSDVYAYSDSPLILWSVDTLDWKYRDKNLVVNNVLSTVQNGDIVLMHDIYGSTYEACQVVIPALLEQGYEFVTVNELFKNNNIELEEGKYYRSIYSYTK